jgi:hypothetical protein
MTSYHGTSIQIAVVLQNGKIDVNKGGGELGKGFYTGEHLWEAKAWAENRYNEKRNNVVEFDHNDNDIEKLDYKIIDQGSACLHKYNIKRTSQTRSYTFGFDMIWAPIVGSDRANGDQYKWESINSQNYLNSTKVIKKLI